MSNTKIEILERALEREKIARKHAEKILESKSLELYQITEELKQANTRLEENISEKVSELKGVFENIVDAYIMMDLMGNVLKMNDAAKKMFGYDVSKESFNLLNILHKDDMKYSIEAFNKLYKEGSFTDFQARVITKNKDTKLVHVNSSIIYNKKGKAVAAQGIVRDITQTTIDQEIFEEQKRQLDIIVDHSPLGIVLTIDEFVVKTNPTFLNLLGYTEEELAGKNVRSLTYEDDKEESSNNMQVMNSGKTDSFTIYKRYLKKDNSILNAKTTVSAVKNKKGIVKHQVAMIEDITTQLAIEKQKKQLVLNLEKSNEELQEYAHMVSHDLKSPLRSIETLVTWLKEDYEKNFDEKGLGYLKMLEEKAENMERLIDGILKYSSVSHDVLVKKQVDINEIITEITDTIYIPEHVKVISLKKLPILKADRIRIQQLFQNIIANAVNYIDKEKGIVEIDCISKNTHWQFSIQDNGKGIPKAYHEKIFKIFQSLGDDENSTGIGLSIVKKIVDLYEGQIWLESKIGIGTTFYFTLKK